MIVFSILRSKKHGKRVVIYDYYYPVINFFENCNFFYIFRGLINENIYNAGSIFR